MDKDRLREHFRDYVKDQLQTPFDNRFCTRIRRDPHFRLLSEER